MFKASLTQAVIRSVGGLIVLAGVIFLILAPLIGESVFGTLWGVEPFAYIGAIALIAGLSVLSLSFIVPAISASRRSVPQDQDSLTPQRWSEVTRQYFELFNHDLGRPLTRILGKERELRAVLKHSEEKADPAIMELLDAIERETPNFRLMVSNIQVLVQLEAPISVTRLEPVEPAEVVRRIVGRYASVANEAQKEITWWSEPAEIGIVYSESSAIEHITTNLIDNAVRFVCRHVEVKLTRNPTHLFIRVRDDGPGISPQYLPHIFDRGWTPEVVRRDEKTSSGLGLFIAKSLSNRFRGDLVVESVAAPEADHHTVFLLSLPSNDSDVTQS